MTNTHHRTELASYSSGQLQVQVYSGASPSNTLVLMIPGGPGISGRYLDALAESFAQTAGGTVARVALPRHEQSVVAREDEALDFKATVTALKEAVVALSKSGYKQVNLVGHSFGALLALSLYQELSVSELALGKVVALNPIFDLEISKDFQSKSQVVAASHGAISTEDQFEAFWRDLLELYFAMGFNWKPLQSLLATETSWIRNQELIQSLPSAKELLEPIRPQAVLLIDADKDLLLERGLWGRILSENPQISINTVRESGHFSILERPETVKRIVFNFFDP